MNRRKRHHLRSPSARSSLRPPTLVARATPARNRAQDAGGPVTSSRSGRVVVHLLLLLIAAVFLFPFVWMLLTSAKTDEEVAAGRRLPALPVFRASSPYQRIDTSGAVGTAALELYGLQVRSLDARIFNIPVDWRVDPPDSRAQLLAVEGGVQWCYRFDSARPISISTRFEFPIDPAELHKLILSLKPDDSWHRIDAELILGGTTWRSTRSTWLAQHRPMSILFQPPTFEDHTSQAKLWVPLHRVSKASGSHQNPTTGVAPAAGGAGREASLRIVLTPSSTPRAIWGKLTRNYDRIFRSIPLWHYVFNSVLLVGLCVAGTLVSTTFVAYAFARLRWPGRGVALVLLLATMMLPAQVTMIPSFLIWRQLGWYNTLNPMWVPAFLGSAFFIFLMVQHLRTIPRELEEAARIDGLGYVQTWYYIILPQVKPAAAAVAVLTFLGAWNDFLGPLIYLRDQSRFPLSLGLFAAQLENAGDWTMIMAGNVLMTLPVIVLFFLCQRYFVRGMAMSGLK
ncbi:MAG: carbohydrate ABC transporter permease [Phycisphaerales bacterium]|nr:carbohydrate ABC transporter permease [Phycisphaerales bacterium]